ncbi:MAG: hypothetical protein RL582_7 [Bacteroidota bacterium]|jgi:hypothetical protein
MQVCGHKKKAFNKMPLRVGIKTAFAKNIKVYESA